MKAVDAQRRRFGYPLGQQVIACNLRKAEDPRHAGAARINMNQKKLHRLNREEKRPVRRRGGRPHRWPPLPCLDGRGCLHTRECFALVTNTSLSGIRVARKLDAIGTRCDRLSAIVSDNGT